MVFSISFFWWATWSWCSFDDWFILYGKAATNCLVHRYVSPCLVISNFRLGSACIVIKNIFNKMSTSSLWNTPAIVCQPFGVLFPFLPWPNVFYGIFYIIYRTSPAWVSPFLLLFWVSMVVVLPWCWCNFFLFLPIRLGATWKLVILAFWWGSMGCMRWQGETENVHELDGSEM
jgi:hypothetical protein